VCVSGDLGLIPDKRRELILALMECQNRFGNSRHVQCGDQRSCGSCRVI